MRISNGIQNRNRRMRNRTYGGVRGRKTKVGRKLLRFPPTRFISAERQGFEPRVPRSTTVFKTAAIDHSATSPKLLLRVALFFKGGAKVRKDFCFPNFWKKKSIRIPYFFFSGLF